MNTQEATRQSQANRQCSVADCHEPSWSRGICGRHYAQWRRRASDDEKRRPTVEDRFWWKVAKKSDDECWLWEAAVTPQGYGAFWDGSSIIGAHRFSYALAHGDAGQMVIDHVCHNMSDCTDAPCAHRRCVNPAHLEAVTQVVNVHRGRTGSHNRSKTHCPRGHEYTPDNTIAVPTGGRRCRSCVRGRTK